MHVVLATKGELSIRVGDSVPIATPGVVSAPDVPHAIDAAGAEVLLVFLDPESDAGASLSPTLGGPFRLLSARDRDVLLDGATPLAIMTSSFGAEWTRRAVSVLGGKAIAERRRVHPRVKKLLALLRTTDVESDASLAHLADTVGLSQGRLMHAFTESIGIPLRPYLQWLKLQRAAAAIVRGASLARAAQDAGFADAAHMSRTFRRMLGASPSELRAAGAKSVGLTR
jgi:AraC-like DNA-binding protein